MAKRKEHTIRSAEIRVTHPFGSIMICAQEMGGVSEVVATMSNGTEVSLFSYYPDELTFTEEEFAGLTLEQAQDLHYQRDLKYLRS